MMAGPAGTVLALVASLLVHGRASRRPGMASGMSGSDPVARTTAWRAVKVVVAPWAECRPLIGAAQHRDLVTQHKDLDVLGGVGAGEERQPAEHANERLANESKGHTGDHAGPA